MKNKEKLLEIFEELLEDYETEFDAANSQLGSGNTSEYGPKKVAEYRKKFTEALHGDNNEK